jgi:quercetin dioxygenase-like cupin family protein
MQWTAGPSTLPAGVRLTVIEGDPRETGPFTMRLLFPAGTRVAPHFHPGIEHATILSGVVSFGVGKAFDAKGLRRVPVGGFWMMPAGVPHFGIVEEDTIIQAHGIGPWQTTYVNEDA